MRERPELNASTAAHREQIRRAAGPACAVLFPAVALVAWWVAPPAAAVIGYCLAGTAMFLYWHLMAVHTIAGLAFQLVFMLLVAILPSKISYAPLFQQLFTSLSLLLSVFFALVWISKVLARSDQTSVRGEEASRAADEA